MARIDTTIYEILNSLKYRLVSQEVFGAGSVYLTLTDDEPQSLPPKVPHYLMIKPGRQTIHNYEKLTIDNSVFLTLVTFTGLETSHRKDIHLTDLTYGAYPKVAEIIYNLHEYDLLDVTQTDQILARPLLVVEIDEPRQYKTWVHTRIEFSCMWSVDALAGDTGGSFTDEWTFEFD